MYLITSFGFAPLTAGGAALRGAIWQQVTDIRHLATEFRRDLHRDRLDRPAMRRIRPDGPGTVALYAARSSTIGIPVLSLAHVTKEGDLRYPFGSVFWHNWLGSPGRSTRMANAWS